MDVINTILTPQFITSVIISVMMTVGFIRWQWKEYSKNAKAINKMARFFAKKEDYASVNAAVVDDTRKDLVTSVIIKNVADDDAELKNLIRDINDYVKKSKGTVAFSIIQNKTERRISMLYETATSKLSFPTHIGLMGTFAGVFVGLMMFLWGTFYSGGITDSTIQSLITGVLVSMITSCFGIGFLISSHTQASEASNQVDKDKNEFYEWVQNELMPSVDVSMVEAIGKLHETIDQFEPAFSGVISEFKDAFRDVTGAFGSDFRDSVKIVSSAVKKMGDNMDSINDNIRLQDKLLTTIRSKELNKSMEAFVAASQKFSEITGSLDQFERARRLMLIAAQETINLQREFNDSLSVPKQVAVEINSILNRITKFEDSINKLGTDIDQTKLIGEKTIKEISDNIQTIKKKQKVAENYADLANDKLQVFFEEYNVELGAIAKRYNEALEKYLSDYEVMLQDRKAELEKRKQEFTDAIDEKFSLEDIRSEFSSLKKLNAISERLDQLAKDSVKSEKLSKALTDIRLEINAMTAAQEQQSKGLLGKIVGNSNSSAERIMQERDKAVKEAEEARRNEATAKQQVELNKKEINDLKGQVNRLEGYVNSLNARQQVNASQVSQERKVVEEHKPIVNVPSPSVTSSPSDHICVEDKAEVAKEQVIGEKSAKQGFLSRLFHKKKK